MSTDQLLPLVVMLLIRTNQEENLGVCSSRIKHNLRVFNLKQDQQCLQKSRGGELLVWEPVVSTHSVISECLSAVSISL